jgi:hypothetical protein
VTLPVECGGDVSLDSPGEAKRPQPVAVEPVGDGRLSCPQVVGDLDEGEAVVVQGLAQPLCVVNGQWGFTGGGQ